MARPKARPKKGLKVVKEGLVKVKIGNKAKARRVKTAITAQKPSMTSKQSKKR